MCNTYLMLLCCTLVTTRREVSSNPHLQQVLIEGEKKDGRGREIKRGSSDEQQFSGSVYRYGGNQGIDGRNREETERNLTAGRGVHG